MNENPGLRQNLQESIELDTAVIRAFSDPVPVVDILRTSAPEDIDRRLAEHLGCPVSFSRIIRKHPLDIMTAERLDRMRQQLQLYREQLASLDD